MTDEVKRSLSMARLRFNSRSPFFSVLLSNLKVIQVDDNDAIQTMATDGSSLFINGRFWLGLTVEERDFGLAHELLHIAFNHMGRLNGRHPEKWNCAGDYAINLDLQQAGFAMVKGVLFDFKYHGMTADEIYALLPPVMKGCGCGGILPGEPAHGEAERWKGVLDRAIQAERMYGDGSILNILKFGEFAPIVDWRTALWDVMGNDVDFDGFDRRLIHEEIYTETLIDVAEAKGMCAICIDTSGSVMDVLGQFVAEVKEIVDLYQIKPPLYYADAEVIGPLEIEEIERPRGGGGTSFVPFFEEVESRGYQRVVYFSDLDGEYPRSTEAEVLWVVPAGVTRVPPFGRVVKILGEGK